MYRYQVAKGQESRVFAGDGVKNLGDGTVESDHELNSPYLSLIDELKQQAHTADQLPAPAAPAPQLPEPKVAPALTPAAPVAPAIPAQTTSESEATA